MAELPKDLNPECSSVFFNGVAGNSRIISWETARKQNRKVFGSIQDTPEYHSSIVAHEVAHNLYPQIFKSIGKEIERPLTEFVSYVVQIETMKEPEKKAILRLWPGNTFESEWGINSIAWAASPNMFGIMSYHYYLNNPYFMKSVLAGEVQSGDRLLILY